MSSTPASPSLIARLRFLAGAMLGAYLVLNLLLAVAVPLIGPMPLYCTTAITVPPMVLAMVYAVIPAARRLL